MKSEQKILLIDDDPGLSRVLEQQLADEGFAVRAAKDGESGLTLFEKQDFDIVISDLAMPGMNGLDVLRTIRKRDAEVIFILITAYGTVDDAITACRAGADDFLTKPFGIEQLRFVIEKAVRFRALERENLALRTQVQSESGLENMIGRSAAMQQVFQKIRKVAPSDATVLILGESGTGKELCARAIHALGLRKSGPFIPVDCTAIPENLMESELFGHVKGAFTGATKDRSGKFVQARGGTLFLDEIAELRSDLQAKLLRVLQERKIQPVGSNRIIDVDVRIIAATNQDLSRAVKEGAFRQDLYYRLAVIELQLPSLRERIEDIPLLIDHFVQKHGKGQSWIVEPAFCRMLSRRDWPGNVRELENAVQRALVLAEHGRLTPDDLILPESSPGHASADEAGTLEAIEKNAILRALDQTGGNQTRAAKILGIPRHVLIYRMKKWQIDSP